MRTVHETRTERHTAYASPLVRAIGACDYAAPVRAAVLEAIAAPALMGGVWALPAPAAPIFARPFPASVYDGETIVGERDGFTYVATIHADPDADAPWDAECGHGPFSDWRPRSSKAPGELILNDDRDSCRFYDFAEACRIARAEGWRAAGDEGMTPRQRAAHAARADFARLRAWCTDDWYYVGVAVTVSRNGIRLTDDYSAAVWGIESDAGEYLTETAEGLTGEALEMAQSVLDSLLN